MALFDRDARRILLGVGIGAGSLLVAPVVGATLAAAVRPVLKALLKHSILAAERSRERLAVLAESFEDIVAEVRAEVEEELAPAQDVEVQPNNGAAKETRSAQS